jgi:hypothetical protein
MGAITDKYDELVMSGILCDKCQTLHESGVTNPAEFCDKCQQKLLDRILAWLREIVSKP